MEVHAWEPERRHTPVFAGSAVEYFGIWIVNVCLIVLTIYLYAPWAKVRRERYFATHTMLDGRCADYHAQPRQLVVGSLFALALVLFLTFGDLLGPTAALIVFLASFLLMPLLTAWAAARSRRFRAAMTGWRNVRFRFDGTPAHFLHYRVIVPVWMGVAIASSVGVADVMAGESATVFYAIPALTALVALLSLPVFRTRFAQYIASHYRFGDERFQARLSVARVYRIHAQAWLSGVGYVALLLLLFWLIAWVLDYSFYRSPATIFRVLFEGDVPPSGRVAVAATFIAIVLALAAIPGRVTLEALMRNHVFDNTRSEAIGLRSTIRPRSLVWLRFSNAIALLLTLGLAWPWARVRRTRFFLANTLVIEHLSLESLLERQRDATSGIGDEFGDVLQIDVGLGF